MMRALPDPVELRELEELKMKIERERGFNCGVYKNRWLERRIGLRMRVHGRESYASYAALLDVDAEEYDRLLDALTINVSRFFRDRAIWKTVADSIVSRLFDPPDVEIRVWCAGSAAGEEPYSLVILLHEWAAECGRLADLERFRIVGTDIDRRSLEIAHRAEYPELSLEETPADLRARWFSPVPPHRLDSRALRHVSFLQHDLISDAALTDQRLIVCRNVMIYFERSTQEALFQRFYDALLPGGFLMMGKVEALLGPARSRFRMLNMRERIYQKPG